MSNKVKVNIFDREYTIIGEANPEYIARLAAHVDSRMQEIADADGSRPTSEIATLAAVNITDDYCKTLKNFDEMMRQKQQVSKDSDHYIQLWEEAKKNFESYKAEAQAKIEELLQEKEGLHKLLSEKNREIDELNRNKQRVALDAQKDSVAAVEEIKAKYKELENSYFDLQMEDVQLKSEMEKLKAELRNGNERKGY